MLPVIAPLFSKRWVGDRLAMLAMDPNLMFFGEMFLLLSILFWVSSLEDIIFYGILSYFIYIVY